MLNMFLWLEGGPTCFNFFLLSMLIVPISIENPNMRCKPKGVWRHIHFQKPVQTDLSIIYRIFSVRQLSHSDELFVWYSVFSWTLTFYASASFIEWLGQWCRNCSLLACYMVPRQAQIHCQKNHIWTCFGQSFDGYNVHDKITCGCVYL